MQTDVTKLDRFMPGQALCFNLYPGTKILSFVFCKNEVHLETPVFQILENKCYSFHFCAQNKITSENIHSLIALVNTYLTFLIRTTDVVNGIHCIKGAKVRKFYVYKFTNNLSIDKIY